MSAATAHTNFADELLRKVSESTYELTGKDFLLELTTKVAEILGMVGIKEKICISKYFNFGLSLRNKDCLTRIFYYGFSPSL